MPVIEEWDKCHFLGVCPFNPYRIRRARPYLPLRFIATSQLALCARARGYAHSIAGECLSADRVSRLQSLNRTKKDRPYVSRPVCTREFGIGGRPCKSLAQAVFQTVCLTLHTHPHIEIFFWMGGAGLNVWSKSMLETPLYLTQRIKPRFENIQIQQMAGHQCSQEVHTKMIRVSPCCIPA